MARVHLPPLRGRKEDIPNLVDYAIARLNRQYNSKICGISNEAMTALFLHDWPGNIRELNNIVESAFIKCRSKTIEFVDMPPNFTKRLNFIDDTELPEGDKLLTVLAASDWNKSAAAKKLNWSRMRIYSALKRYSLTYV